MLPFYNHVEVKLLINIFLNTSAENAIRLVRAHTFFPPATVFDFFRKLEALRPLLVEAALSKGCELSFAEERNKAFFALEYFEQCYLRNLLHELNQILQLQSVILVHDGFYSSLGSITFFVLG